MKKVILTFDDGPSQYFSDLLNYLDSKKIKTIFFCLGKNLEIPRWRKLIINAIKKGHVIGNHSYSHPNFNKISIEEGREEILKTDKIIEEIYSQANVKRKLKLFRFPHFLDGGLFKRNKLREILKDLGYENLYFNFKQRVAYSNSPIFHLFRTGRGSKYDVYCDIDPSDWNEKLDLEKILKIIKRSKEGDIIGLHDCKRTSTKFIKEIYEELNKMNLI